MRKQTPSHVAIIMDGNGRWAKNRGLSRTEGHARGAEAARTAIEHAVRCGIPHVTLYAFSMENWQRPEEEVSALMGLFTYYMGKELEHLHKNGVRLHFIGDRSHLPSNITQQMHASEQHTQHNTALHLHVALSYGSRQEISHAACEVFKQLPANSAPTAQQMETLLAQQMYLSSDVPDPQLLIRTGGDQRLSNFLLWQCAYSELYFTDVLWPDFTTETFDEALADFSKRERRFGKIQAVKADEHVA